jgi:hypothetical protein
VVAQPAYNSADDPVEILRLLPEEYHPQFLDEYDDAVDRARRPEGYRALQEMLRLWRLRSLAYSSRGYSDRLADARRGDSTEARPRV